MSEGTTPPVPSAPSSPGLGASAASSQRPVASLPAPRYAHTLHVEAPQPRPFAFLLGISLLAFAVPAALVFAFLRVVAEPAPAAQGPTSHAAPVDSPGPAVLASAQESLQKSNDLEIVPDPQSAPATLETDASVTPDAGGFSGAAAPASPASPASPATPAVAHVEPPLTYELGMGILHSCKTAAGKVLQGYQDCGSAGELDRYLSRAIAQEIAVCSVGAPRAAVTLRASVDYVALGGAIEVVDGKMMPVPSPWATCLASHFVLENLAKIRHIHPKYTLTYRVIPQPSGE